MKIGFTICSNNYLGQAKILQTSFLEHNPDYKFFIGLVDLLDTSIDYKNEFNDSVIVIEEKIIPGFDSFVEKYDIVELNTAIKPFLFKYLIQQYKPTYIHYLDPDIKVYGSIGVIDAELGNKSMLLTPHFYSPVPDDGLTPFENLALNHGIYNLGYLGVNANHAEAIKCLDWWGLRTSHHGYSKVEAGFFVDQLWINLVPIFFKDVVITTHFGCNVGPWNLHERFFENKGKTVVMDGDKKPLLFYHFSSYSFFKPDLLSKYYNRYSFTDRPDLVGLYNEYHQQMDDYKCSCYSGLDCRLNLKRAPKPTVKSTIKSYISRGVNKALSKI